MKGFWITICLLAVFPLGLRAQDSPAFYDYVRGELDWYTLETDHFLIHFHSDSSGTGSRTANVVARVAEDIYGPITELYDYEPDTRVSFILKDYEDYSNGATYFFDNVIEIWAPALNSPFRGDHDWLRNVITHEFTHMVQVQKTMKANRRMPFIYLQFLDYEDVKRPDVLYGFPNIIATYPIPILNNPAWLAEGSAQYQREWMDYDRWDTHRDMLLRTQLLEGRELTLAEMGGFYSHNSLMRESVYNHGYAFSAYLADRFGEGALLALSAELGNWDNWNFEQAARDAFGIDGAQLYEEWIADLRMHYRQETATPGPHIGETIETEGFLNMEARYSPDGTRIAYISNQGEDFSRTSLYIRERDGKERSLVKQASGGFDFRPDGLQIVYSRTRDTPTGRLVSDLWTIDVSSGKSEQLTRGERASDPAYAPDGNHVAFVFELDGTSNLALLDVESGTVTRLTDNQDGSQIREPVFSANGDWIYFSYRAGRHGRDIYRIRREGGPMEAVLATPADERSPTMDPTGGLVFSSDPTGVYNLYLFAGEGEAIPITNEVGGAFMPSIASSGDIVFSRYRADGYALAVLPADSVQEAEPSPVARPPYLRNREPDTGLQQRLTTARDDSSRAFTALEPESRYEDVYTSLSFLPVVRLDSYISRRRSTMDVRLPDRTRAETLWRNTKLGVYAATREILGGLSFFGGALLAPGSNPGGGGLLSPTNLLDLERDMFVQVDYARGFGLTRQRWAPQLSVQLFNVRRNVPNGLSVEEFPCTACHPDTTLVDLSYNLWEADFLVRSKVNRTVLLEAGYRYSPYRVTTERFQSSELEQTVPASSSRYFIGRAFHAKAILESFHPYRDADVVPSGVRIETMFERENGRLLDAFELDEGQLSPVYERENVNRVVLNARFGFHLGDWPTGGAHGVEFRLRGSSILGPTVNDFYDDYVGGLTGARGYPFYALGGNETLWLQASYTFPLLPRVSKQVLFTYVDKVYLRTYSDVAVAFSGKWPGFSRARKDVGTEVRIGLGSYYLLPTSLFVSATYGLDEFDFRLDEGFLTPDGQNFVRYGHEWQWHVGVLFGFDQL